MTASPEQFARRDTLGWYVYTDQCIVLSRRCETEAEVRAEGNQIAADLRASMRREHYNDRQVAARVLALRIGFGCTVFPHGTFAPAAGLAPP